MELVEYGLCQIVRLMNIFRPQGGAYFPELAAKVAAKYQFAKVPAVDDLSKEQPIKFQIGKFNDVQILELGVFSDGLIVNGKCPTELLEHFLHDVLTFAIQETKSKPVLAHREELHFESILTVKATADLAAFVAPRATDLIGKFVGEKIGVPYRTSGMMMDCDIDVVKTKRKPSRVFIERKVGFPFKENIFLCIAPLRTKDHIELLTALEREAQA